MGNRQSINPDILTEIVMSKDLIPLGEGGYGTVYTSNKHPRFAIKKSKKPNSCKAWQREYDTQRDIYNKFNAQFPQEFKDILEVLPVYNMQEIDGYCYILMDRICPLKKHITDIKELYGKSAHALFGNTTGPDILDIDGRGIFISQNTLGKLLNLHNAVKCLAIFMAWLQYGENYDGVDIEIIVGIDCKTNKIKLYVIDFGMVSKMGSDKDISNSLWAVEYFPLSCENSQGICGYAEEIIVQLFKQTYIDTAEKYGYGEVARVNYEKST